MFNSICISSGHGKHVRGASGVLDEVDEARKVVDRVAALLGARGVTITKFHDDTSTSQDENLHRIVEYHNTQERELDVSVHFNAYEQTAAPRGTEVLYVSEDALAGQLSAAIASDWFIDRGAKYNNDLYFLNNTTMPAVLLEVCFVDSTADAEIYRRKFEAICEAIATVLGGTAAGVEAPPSVAMNRVDIAVSGRVEIFVNGQLVE
jgi:N-acetylmuramoyl-L-alanine amidase